MSGIFLIVWDDKPDEFLKPTKGGWPHITIGYSGKNLCKENLVHLSQSVFEEFALEEITLDRLYINSFTTSKGVTRHDVLAMVSEKDSKDLQKARESLDENEFDFKDLHVTLGIHPTLESAQAHLEQAKLMLPRKVTITGVTID